MTSVNNLHGTRNALTLIIGLMLLWQIVYLMVGDVALSSPLATLRYTATLVTSDTFAMHLYDTMRAFTIAFILSVVIGLLVGFWLGFDRLSSDALEPMVVTVYAIPKLTLYPIVLLAFGIGEIFTGLRVGFSLTLIGSLLAEMFASQRGLGYLLMTGIGLHNIELVMSVTLLIVVFAAAVSTLLLQIDRRLHRQG